jgi:hypothetical protein
MVSNFIRYVFEVFSLAKIEIFQFCVTEKEKVVLLRPQNNSISTNHLKEGSVLK